MAIISEVTSADGSNGGDPDKKPQKEVQNLPTPQDLPDEINERIFALVERCDYPNLSCTSKAFCHIITSPGLFETRSRLSRTESVLYAFIGFPPFGIQRWYILHRRNNSLRLRMINSLPPMIPGSAVVTIGHEMYIIGGKLNPFPPVSVVIVIDCRFHTWRYLPSMRRARNYAASGVIDGKIYVIGGCMKRGGDWVEVFDVNNQIWETMPGPNPNTTSLDGNFAPHVVMEEKIYILDGMYCLAYEPRRSKWESWGIGSPQRWFWHGVSCVVDDMLYSIDHMCCLGYPIIVFDPKVKHWRTVKGVHSYDLLNLVYCESKMANFGGKLVILASSYPSWLIPERDTWCIVVALERREDGEIWGNVESTSRVLSSFMTPFIEFSRTVTV